MTLAKRCMYSSKRGRKGERAVSMSVRGDAVRDAVIPRLFSSFILVSCRTIIVPALVPRERESIGQRRVTRSPRLGPWDIFKRARLVLLAHHAEPRIGIRVRASVSASFRDSLSLSSLSLSLCLSFFSPRRY